MSEIGVGLIGYGLGGRVFHAPFVEATPSLALRAVVSSQSDTVKADYPEVRVVPDVEALLAEPGIDLVVVSSPDQYHADHAMAALNAGKHVLVDKPFATSLVEARKIAAVAQSSGRLLTVFHNRRWDSDFLTLRRLIAEGVLGPIVQFESHFDRWRPEPAAVWKEARDGGSWLDLGPHLVDQTICLFGVPQAIQLHMATLRAGAPAADFFHALLVYDGLRVVLHSTKLAADHGLRFAVHGTAGSWIKHGLDSQEADILAGVDLSAADWGRDLSEGTLARADPLVQARIVPNEAGDYRLFWQGLARAIRGEGPNPVPPNEALAVMEVLECGLESARSERLIYLDGGTSG